MHNKLSLLLLLSYSILNLSKPSTAQVVPDGTTNTTVDVSGNNFTIEQGDRAGGNLFHSFGEFSVPNGGSAFFNNAVDIVNIFSRVTGGNISNIDGLLGANGTANLFLINPAGIIFGEGARLDIGGSFYGSTADSILFPDGEFSATDLANPPLITINAPIGLNFRDNPGDITVRGDGQRIRITNELEDAMRVNSSSTLGLVGGNINLEGATLKTPGGRIELGSVVGNEQVHFIPLDKGFGLGYESVENFKDIKLSQRATVDASGLVSGDIRIQGNKINILEGSRIEASTLGNFPTDLTPGIIQINALGTISIDSVNSNGLPSVVTSQVAFGAEGDAGNIELTASHLSLDNSRLVSQTKGSGNTGAIKINLSNNFSMNNGGEVKTQILRGGKGNAGQIEITASSLNLSEGSSILSTIGGVGNAGDIDITASSLTLSEVSSIFSTIRGMGNAGEIKITANSLTLREGSRVFSSTQGVGNAGDVTVNIANGIILEGSSLNSRVSQVAQGNAGNINITANSLSLSGNFQGKGSRILADSNGIGNAGNVIINVTEDVSFDDNSIILSKVSEGIGDAGVVNINSDRLFLDGRSFIISNTGDINQTLKNKGNAGDVNINASLVSLSNFSQITSNAWVNAEGQPGNVNINEEKL